LEKSVCKNQEGGTMGKNSYAEDRKEHFKAYSEGLKLPIGGTWQGQGCYSHILKFEENINNIPKGQ
jgi:hypothetical protein